MDVDIVEIVDLWNELYEFRTRQLEREKKLDIINAWPILKHPEAYRLVIRKNKLTQNSVENKNRLFRLRSTSKRNSARC